MSTAIDTADGTIGTTARLAISDPSRESVCGATPLRGSAMTSEQTGGAGNQQSLTVAADSVRGDGIRSLQRAYRYSESPPDPLRLMGEGPTATTGPVTHALAQRDPVGGETVPEPLSLYAAVSIVGGLALVLGVCS